MELHQVGGLLLPPTGVIDVFVVIKSMLFLSSQSHALLSRFAIKLSS
jgi:hypothetical protein